MVELAVLASILVIFISILLFMSYRHDRLIKVDYLSLRDTLKKTEDELALEVARRRLAEDRLRVWVMKTTEAEPFIVLLSALRQRVLNLEALHAQTDLPAHAEHAHPPKPARPASEVIPRSISEVARNMEPIKEEKGQAENPANRLLRPSHDAAQREDSTTGTSL